jgi:hypothetical protein
MKVMVGIDVIQRQTGRSIGAELCLDFSCKLRAHAPPGKDGDAQHRQVAAQLPARIDQIRYAFRRQHRPTIDQNEVQTYPQRRQTARAVDGVVDRGTAHHQTCRRQDAIRVRQLDAFVDFRRQAEVVGGDDEGFQ